MNAAPLLVCAFADAIAIVASVFGLVGIGFSVRVFYVSMQFDMLGLH